MSIQNRQLLNAVIASGTSVSQSIDLSFHVLVGFVTPAAWTTAAIDLEVSIDGTTWFTNMYDSLGVATGIYLSPVVSSGYAVDALALIPYNFVRFRSGTSASPVNQAAARTISVITRPFM
jgi:hypothetical protein